MTPASISRRAALRLGGAAAAVSLGAPTAWADSGGGPVRVLIDDVPATRRTYAFPAEVTRLVLDNGLIRFTFTPDDATAGIVTGWTDVSVTASSVVVDGVELAHNLNGVEPRDPDRQHSFYIDAGGGSSRLVCSQVRVLRLGPDLVEVAFADTTSPRLRHEHHLIMLRGRRGLYGYDIVTAVTDQSINEIRMNTRWDRALLDHSFTWERGPGQQPTYAYLATQTRVGDETWQVDGVNNPALPSPDSNAGGLAAGTVYTKYNWSLYHHENPMFGHFGHGVGVWFTSLGGVTDQTLCASYGSGPNHQDLAVHQDALILNYFSPNHYGQVSYPLTAGYRRLYGPWLTYVTTGDPADPDAMIAQAAQIARTEIAQNRAGCAWVDDPLYPPPTRRGTLAGRLRLADGRPAADFWVLLSTQDAEDVFTLHEPTYFVRTDATGSFRLRGIPPAWTPGTQTPSTYVLYIFAAGGSVTDQYKRTGVTVGSGITDLGEILWAPTDRSTFLWQIGRADRSGGEFALATDPVRRTNPRAYEKPARVPADLTFTVGADWEPQNWYYAQTKAGTWTITFDLDRPHTGTAFLTVSSSMQAGNAPKVAVNGSTADITGVLPPNNDSTIGRQADRSGFPRLATLSFPASALLVGTNTVTLSRTGSGGGMGWDTLLLEVDEDPAPPPARLTARLVRSAATDPQNAPTLGIEITNIGTGTAHDVRLDEVLIDGTRPDARHTAATVNDRDPNRYPVPIAASIPAGGTAHLTLTLARTGSPVAMPNVTIVCSSDGGRIRATTAGRAAG
jgi:rhamnogalacturonan endolyase